MGWEGQPFLKDKNTFYTVLGRVGIARDGKTDAQLAGELARLALQEFSEREAPVWLKTTVTPGREVGFGEKPGSVRYSIPRSGSFAEYALGLK